MKIEEKSGKLIISEFDPRETYKIALKIEKDGISFYQKLLDKVDEPKAKEALKFLLNQEDKHLKFFQDCMYKIKEAEEDNFEEDNLLSSLDFGVFWPYQKIEDLDSILTNSKKAFKLGVAIEDKAIQFYQACKDKIKIEKTKKELDNIIEEEKKHKALFESLLGV